MSSCLPCCSTQSWNREVYFKRAEHTDKNAIVIKKNTIYDEKKWSTKTSLSISSGRVPEDFGRRYIPAGRYVSDQNNPKKIFVESEINGRYYRDKGFWGDSQHVVRGKACMATLTGFVAIGAVINMVVNVVRIPLNVIATCYHNGNSAVDALKDRGASDALFVFVRRTLVDMTHIFTEGAWSVVRVPFYALVFQAALIYTIFCPYDGRQIAADIEREWHYPCISSDDVVRREAPDSFNGVLNMLNNKVRFLFFCFQPRGSFADIKDQFGTPRYVRLEAVKA
ncbi:MAG: hypothetical protein V4494_06500 [Chlamydiota bacterium]